MGMTLSNKPRFIVADTEVSQDLGVPFIVILSDFHFWTEYADELSDWCNKNPAKIEGMTVSIYNEPTLTAFILKWQ